MTRKITDSNALQSAELRSYLAASPSNYAVLNDYASMEAYKGNTLASIFRSMEIACQYPRQIIVLKTTGRICALVGRAKGLQRRMIDERQTRDFPTFCRRLRAAQDGDGFLQKQLLEHGRVADLQMDQVLADAPTMSNAIRELRGTFDPDELKIIRLKEPFTTTLIEKSMKFIVDLANLMMRRHPTPPQKIRNLDELRNTFIFRHSVSAFVWALDWIAQGGADGVRPDRMRNDLIDIIFVTYATFFDGLLSKDEKAQRVYQDAKFILSALAGSNVVRSMHRWDP